MTGTGLTTDERDVLVKPVHDPEQVEKAIDVFAHGFSRNVFTTCFAYEDYYKKRSLSSNKSEQADDLEVRKRYFAPTVRAVSSSNTLLQEAGDFAMVALWKTPTPNTQSPDTTNIGIFAANWVESVHRMKEKHLRQDTDSPIRPHYSLLLVARNKAVPPVKHSFRAIMMTVLERAEQERLPVWLQATDASAVAIYERFGFRTIDTIVIGKGQVGSEGLSQEGGDGITAWIMVFNLD